LARCVKSCLVPENEVSGRRSLVAFILAAGKCAWGLSALPELRPMLMNPLLLPGA